MRYCGQTVIGPDSSHLGLATIRPGQQFYDYDTGSLYIGDYTGAAWINPWTIEPGETLYVSGGGELDLGGFIQTTPATGTVALATGIAGGQTIYGGTGAGEHLTLISTSNATPGRVIVQHNANADLEVNSGTGMTPGYSNLKFSDRGITRWSLSKANSIWANIQWEFYDTFGVYVQTVMTVHQAGRVGFGTVAPARIIHAQASDAVTNAITYAQRLTHVTSGTAAPLFGVGDEHELEDGNGNVQVASEVVTLWADAQNTLESPLRRWTTYPKGAIGPAYGAFWTRRDVDGTAVPVVPNGTGDVTAILRVMYVIELIAGGNTLAGEITALTGGGAVDLYNAGGEQFTITVAADGSVSVVRAAGADSANIGLWMIWI